MNDESMLAAQRDLRRRLLDNASVIGWRPARDLAAHLLLHLDEPGACWSLAADWLRETFDADRVDCGFGGPGEAWYRPQGQALRRDREVPSVLGHAFDGAEGGVQAAWRAHGAMVLADITQAAQLSERERAALLGFGTRIKVAAPIIDVDSGPLGLVCLDWLDLDGRDRESRWARFEDVVGSVLGPVMAAARRLSQTDAAEPTAPLAAPDLELARLTPAEKVVVRLAADGLSYKEIARRLNRSFSTVDHQLRSARGKLGVTSTARLIHRLAGAPRH